MRVWLQVSSNDAEQMIGMVVQNFQGTIGGEVTVSGIGVHGGKPAAVTFLPAEVNTGIVFQRADIDGSPWVPAHVEQIGATDLCTSIGARAARIDTIEHLMAAVTALGIDNLRVRVSGPEVPILDGSSREYVAAFARVGLVQQEVRRRYLRILKPVRVEAGSSWGEFRPYDGTRYEVEIDFDVAVIGRQKFAGDMSAEVFSREIADARTFGFMKDVARLHAAGLALGASLDNTVAIGEDNQVMNPEGLRFADEFVRHKTLDAVGDLALAGMPFIGCYASYRGGHRLNSEAVKALLADASAYEIVQG